MQSSYDSEAAMVFVLCTGFAVGFAFILYAQFECNHRIF